GAAGQGLVRALRPAVRHHRGQQLVLPSAVRGHLQSLGAAGAAGLRVRGKGEPLPDAPEEAQGPRGAAGERAVAGAAPGAAPGAGALPTAAALALRPRTAATLPGPSPQRR